MEVLDFFQKQLLSFTRASQHFNLQLEALKTLLLIKFFTDFIVYLFVHFEFRQELLLIFHKLIQQSFKLFFLGFCFMILGVENVKLFFQGFWTIFLSQRIPAIFIVHHPVKKRVEEYFFSIWKLIFFEWLLLLHTIDLLIVFIVGFYIIEVIQNAFKLRMYLSSWVDHIKVFVLRLWTKLFESLNGQVEGSYCDRFCLIVVFADYFSKIIAWHHH